MSDTRNRIIETTSRLLVEQGYDATGLSQIVKEREPKGVPLLLSRGKRRDLRGGAAANGPGGVVIIRGAMEDGETAGEGVRALITTIGERMEASGYRAGGSITTVALESASNKSRLTRVCRDVYADWRRILRERIVEDGVDEERAGYLKLGPTAAMSRADLAEFMLQQVHSDEWIREFPMVTN